MLGRRTGQISLCPLLVGRTDSLDLSTKNLQKTLKFASPRFFGLFVCSAPTFDEVILAL